MRADWDLRKHEWGRRAFYRKKHHQFLHMPIGIGGGIRGGMREMDEKGCTVKPPYIMLDDETGFLTAEMLIAIEEFSEGDPDAVVWEPAVLYSKFHLGPFGKLKQSIIELNAFVRDTEGIPPSRMYNLDKQLSRVLEAGWRPDSGDFRQDPRRCGITAVTIRPPCNKDGSAG